VIIVINYFKIFRQSRIQDSSLTLEDAKKDTMSKSYNRSKRMEKCSFDSDFMNSSQSVKFALAGNHIIFN